MFFDRLESIGNYGKGAKWREVILQFIHEYPSAYEKKDGTYRLCHGAFYNIMSAELKADNAYEYHKKYIDVHCTLSGTEKIEGAFFSLFIGTGNYSEENDAGFFPDIPEKDCVYYVETGNCAVFFPYEAHKSLLLDDRGDSSKKIKKAVLKIPVELWDEI